MLSLTNLQEETNCHIRKHNKNVVSLRSNIQLYKNYLGNKNCLTLHRDIDCLLGNTTYGSLGNDKISNDLNSNFKTEIKTTIGNIKRAKTQEEMKYFLDAEKTLENILGNYNILNRYYSNVNINSSDQVKLENLNAMNDYLDNCSYKEINISCYSRCCNCLFFSLIFMKNSFVYIFGLYWMWDFYNMFKKKN